MLPGKETEEPGISYVHEPWKHGSSQLFAAKEDFESTNNATRVDTSIPKYTRVFPPTNKAEDKERWKIKR